MTKAWRGAVIRGAWFVGFAAMAVGCVGAVDESTAFDDADGGTEASLVADVTLLPAGATWRYLEGAPPSGWQASSFVDTSWKAGKAELGFGDGDEVTVLSPGSPKKYAFYFRTTFNVSTAAAYTSVRVRFVRDDGAVLYLNGTEFARSNMPSGTITPTTWASTVVGVRQDEQKFYEVTVPAGLLKTGTNVIAAEVHQFDAGSSDISFNATVVASASNCVISGTTYADGAKNPANSCEVCSAVAANTSWTAVANCTPPTPPPPTTPPPTTPPPTNTSGVGASLPISYSLSAIGGTKWFVSTSGSDGAAGSEAAPLRNLATAIAKVGSGQAATIIVRGGEYAEGNLTIPSGRAIRIVAYPGETPVFRGSQKFASGWNTEGSLAWHAYTTQPVTDGYGISFTTGVNQTSSQMGKYPDQAWTGSTQLQQVGSKASVTAGKFYVESGRLYVAGTDAAKGTVEASDKDRFINITGANSVLEGLRITKFSNSANDGGVVNVASVSGVALRNVEILESAFVAAYFGANGPGIMVGATMDHVTIDGSNWMAVNTTYVDDFTMQSVKITGSNRFSEFTTSPQSGALKTSRCRRVKVLDSRITGNNSHGLWFDQSNVDVDVAGNYIDGNAGSAVFFEISDDLLLINNFIRSTGGNRPLKLAGSSGLKLVNNTIIGGSDPIGIYTDSRSKPGCADPNQPLCSGSYSSDRRTAATRPATLDWMPRLDLMLNNIVAYPSSSGYCGGTTGVCITSTNSTASAPIQTIIHGADTARGIPKTVIDGNVYANGTGAIVRVPTGSYTTTSAWSSAAAGSPIYISGIDANSKYGNSYVNADGSPTSSLVHTQAVAVPSNADINKYIPAGTKHYGWLK